MLTYIDGDLFQSPAKVLVNTVNTKGVMGKGIALEFKRIYPEMFHKYRALCERGEFDVGTLYLYKTPHKWILNFPTKKHWRHPSRVEYIEAGLKSFTKRYAKEGIPSVAFPALGCGNGELDYEKQVQPLMQKYLGKLSIPTFIYLNRPQTEPPEHKSAKEIADWLRSEPYSLPFDEVWWDIVQILKAQTKFETPTKRNPYTVYATEPPPSLTATTKARAYRFESNDLLEFWQQLRDYGFSYRSIAPEHHRISYLMPVFERLPYVHRIAVSEYTDGRNNRPAVGLQVVLPPLPATPSQKELFAS
jgi:O-acetyl-ADP-ribose deacetylase (regulator of RNase III)